MFDLHLPRRSLLTGLVLAPLTVAACSAKKHPAAAPSSGTTSSTSPHAPAATGKGLPADLLAVMTALYVGGKVPASPGVVPSLLKRKALGRSVSVNGTTGTWKGTAIATVTQGKDVTLLVKAPTWRVVGGWWPSMSVAAAPTGVRRVLVVGTDARPGENVGRSRGDSLHLVAFNGKGGGGIVGIPRDSWVPLATGGVGKINSSLAYGGPQKLQQTVTSVSGVPVEGYFMTGFQGFENLINAVGGLRFHAPITVKGTEGDNLVTKGPNLLNGFRALNFARARHTVAGGDFGRSANQGLIIRAAAAMSRAAGPLAIPKYLTKVSPHLSTNLSPEHVLTLAAMAFRTYPSQFRSAVVPGTSADRGGQSVVLLAPGASRMFADLKDGRLG